MNTRLLILLVILIADVSSALGVVYSRHDSRVLSVQLGALETIRDDSLAEWSRLQLEQALLADAGQIESKARLYLNMLQPADTRILVIRP